jgi:type II secretory pathway pseudopilin PulG
MSAIGNRRGASVAGFTMVETLIGFSLMAVVFTALLSAYVFLGRTLTRLNSTQEQEVRARRAFQQFAQDVGSAVTFTTVSDTRLVFTLQSATGTADTADYAYTAGAGGTGTMTRTYTTSTGTVTTSTLLGSLSACDFNCYTSVGTATSTGTAVKSAQFSYTSVVGSGAGGTRASYSNVSAKVIARNKPTS